MRYRTLLLIWAIAGLLPLTLAAEAPHSGFALKSEPVFEVRDDEGVDDETTDEPDPFLEFFETDPLADPSTIVTGGALERTVWNDDEPAFEGDPAGSLSATYDARQDAGLFGFLLPEALTEASTFTAAAAFVIHSEDYASDPNGFFQISWGLWNTTTTGLNRTGDPTTVADTFELIEFDYFPNVSPIFGGPFVGPGVFGRADPENPSFEFGGAFANFSGLFDLEVSLPLDVPLLAVLEHRPGLDAMPVQVYRIASSDGLLPVQGAVGTVALAFLGLRDYDVDAVGLTLWHDGFGGEAPSVLATLTYHALIVVPGIARPEDLLHAATE
jgi:hypothetical protein